MPNLIIKQKILSRIKQEHETFENSTAEIKHKLVKGIANEYGFVSLIKDILPKNFSIGKGIVVDNENNQSCEADIIIYDNQDISPILFGPDSGLFPLECCRYIIEIKSESNATEIKDAIKKATVLKKLKSINGRGPIFSYFAYSTDIKKTTEFDRYYKYDKAIKINGMLDTICVLGKGYWYKRNDYTNGSLNNTAWGEVVSDNEYVETLGFISGIMNTLNQVSKLGFYLLDPGYVKFSYFHFIKLGLEITPSHIDKYNSFCICEENKDYLGAAKILDKLIKNRDQLKLVLQVFAREGNSDPFQKQIYEAYANKI
jgi:hypothetical protein